MHSTQEDLIEAAERQTRSLAALALTLLLVVTSLYLVETMRAQANDQDCLLAGRADCGLTINR